MRSLSGVGLVVLAVGCTRSGEPPKPRATAESLDAALDATVTSGSTDAGPAAQRSASMFALVARAGIGRLGNDDDDIAQALPLVQRVGDGLAVFSEYGRAVSAGPGPLGVEVASDDEFEVYYRGGDVQGQQLIRWVWTDGKATLASYEEATMRSGPRIWSYSLGPKGVFNVKRSDSYWDAVPRDGSVLALERGTHSVEGIYQGSTAEELSPAHVAVLIGKGPAPALPAGVCPKSMGSAPDGTVVVVVDKCTDGEELGLLLYPPQKTATKPIWVAMPQPDVSDPKPIAVAVASATEAYVGFRETMQTWDGKTWTASKPFDGDHVISLSAGLDRSLWAIARANGKTDGGYVTIKKPGAAKWEDVELPPMPTTPLDDAPYQAPGTNEKVFRKQPVASKADYTLTPRKVDAAGAEILILGMDGTEGFVFSNKPRTPVAKIPSIDTQRAQLAKAYRHKTTALTKEGKGCLSSFLMFPEGTKLDPIAPVDGGPQLAAAEAIVENKPALIVYTKSYSTEEDITAAAKRFASLSPKRVCGAPVIEKDL